MLSTFVGIAVKALQQEVPFLKTKESSGRIFIGVKYEGNSEDGEAIKSFLVESGYVKPEDVVGNFVFIAPDNRRTERRVSQPVVEVRDPINYERMNRVRDSILKYK